LAWPDFSLEVNVNDSMSSLMNLDWQMTTNYDTFELKQKSLDSDAQITKYNICCSMSVCFNWNAKNCNQDHGYMNAMKIDILLKTPEIRKKCCMMGNGRCTTICKPWQPNLSHSKAQTSTGHHHKWLDVIGRKEKGPALCNVVACRAH
jgi:hypothetical protein